uniref:organic cation transporter protein-like n=1 Tax=Ciona intestinalis TaxID=7719 RepID=UPI00089DAD56|nr:organic cation transporter protein-like [Ciona intestinalis]|eukprot:XP_009861187.2 organic cation transporter protein-like [Ciona intestinalis]
MILFDVLLKRLGGAGLSQVVLSFLLGYYNVTSGINGLATVFIAYEPDSRCNVPPLDNSTAYPNLTEPDILNYTTPYDVTKQAYDTCSRYGYDLNTCNGDLTCVNQTYPPVVCDKGYHYDKSLFTETVVSEFNLICDRKYLSSLSTSLYYAGMMIGSILFGNLADMIGRKPTIVLTFIGVLGSMFGITYSTSVEMYMAFRTATAAFGYGTTLGTFVYIMEVVGSEWRTFFGIGNQAFFTLGYMVMSGVAYNWRNWHDNMLVSTLLGVPFLLFAIIVPESPRWLFSKNKNKEGIKVTKLLARINKVTITDEDWEEARKAGEEIEKAKESTSERKYSTLDLFRYRGTFIITIKVMFNWFVNSFVYYGISLNAGALAGDIFVNNTLNGVMEMGSFVLCILLMDRIGRRILLSGMMFLAGIGLIISLVVNEYKGGNQSLETLSLVFAFAAKIGISGSFGVIYILTTELYPTVIRSNGVAAGSVMARVGGIIAPFLIALQDDITWLPNAIFGVLAILAAFASLTFPETNGNGMMETIDEAEIFYKTRKINSQAYESSEEVGMEKKDTGHDNTAFSSISDNETKTAKF